MYICVQTYIYIYIYIYIYMCVCVCVCVCGGFLEGPAGYTVSGTRARVQRPAVLWLQAPGLGCSYREFSDSCCQGAVLERSSR